MPEQRKSRRLGRGLTSLVGNAPIQIDPVPEPPETLENPLQGDSSPTSTPTPDLENVKLGETVRQLLVSEIHPNPDQPRSSFSAEALEELANSIREHGVLQPILVRSSTPNTYQIIAGERRYRACQLLGFERMPAIVQDLSDAQTAEIALVENVQREDLNPLEKALGIARLRDDFGYSLADIAAKLGLNRSSISNTLRLLDLEPEILDMLRDQAISQGHAKALLAHPPGASRVQLALRASQEGWSVRTLENTPPETPTGSLAGKGPSPTRVEQAQAANIRRLESLLSEALSTRAKIRTTANGRKGTITIEYYDLDHFDALLSRLGVSKETV